jgi:hypothetical protein
MTTSKEIADELGVAAGSVLFRRIEKLGSGEKIPVVGISIDFTYLSGLVDHPTFDETVNVIARRLTTAAHADDLVAMHGWDFAVVAERLGDDGEDLLAYGRELERAVSAEPIDVDRDRFVFTPTVRSGPVGSLRDLRLLFLSQAEQQARQEERRRARLEAYGPQRLDDIIDNAMGPVVQYSHGHPEAIEIESIWGNDVTSILQMQLAVDMARNTELLDHEMVSRNGRPYTIKVARLNPLIELVKAVDSYLTPLRAAKLEEMHQNFLARCRHEPGDGKGPCSECEERWKWHLHEPRGIQLQ